MLRAQKQHEEDEREFHRNLERTRQQLQEEWQEREEQIVARGAQEVAEMMRKLTEERQAFEEGMVVQHARDLQAEYQRGYQAGVATAASAATAAPAATAASAATEASAASGTTEASAAKRRLAATAATEAVLAATGATSSAASAASGAAGQQNGGMAAASESRCELVEEWLHGTGSSAARALEAAATGGPFQTRKELEDTQTAIADSYCTAPAKQARI